MAAETESITRISKRIRACIARVKVEASKGTAQAAIKNQHFSTADNLVSIIVSWLSMDPTITQRF